MNVFTNLLFLQGHLTDPHLFDDENDRYAKGYGNRVASERYFAPLGHARHQAPRSDAPAAVHLNPNLATCGCG